ncbi:FBOX, partial [Musa troglodytarum]
MKEPRSDIDQLKPGKMTWKDLPINLLLQIFKESNPIDQGAVARVCHSWQMTFFDSSLWRIVDLGSLQSNSIWVNTSIRLSQALRTMVTYGHVNIRCIIFHPQLHIKDEHLNLIAQGCPHLKRLVVPRWEVMDKNAMCNAIKNFRDLESMIVPGNTSI